MTKSLAFASLLVAAFLCVPARGQPRQWVDDFQTAASYDSNSIYAPCPTHGGGPPTKYTVMEATNADIFSGRAVSGGGRLTFTNRSVYELVPGLGRAEFALIGWYGVGLGCPGEPPDGTTTEPFTSENICVYGGIKFSPWQLKTPPGGACGWDIRGADDKPGVANYDDDLDGATDEDDESPARHPTTVNNGFGNPNGTGFWAGRDAKPGVAGVDDDANGLMDDVGETGWAGSDDSDDKSHHIWWMALNTSPNSTSLFFLCFDVRCGLDNFSLREIIGVNSYSVEWQNEIVMPFYTPETKYNWVLCASGTCYGAMLWTGTDMANPDETLGPTINSNHTQADANVVGPVFVHHSAPVPQFNRTMRFYGNSNFADTFWVVSGNTQQYYPSPSADLDKDKDVDGFDFLTFSNCYNGSNKPPLAACANQSADLDKDGDVDGFDFLTFSNCYNGSNRKPLAACFPPNLTTCGS